VTLMGDRSFHPSISMGEPPGWDWRGSKMAVLKYLICGYLIGQKWLKMAKNG